MSRITEDVSKVRNYIGPGILYAINLITTFGFTIYAMLKVDTTLTLCTLLPLPILSISIYYVSNMINQKSAAIQAQLSTLTSEAQETYAGIKLIKSYVKEKAFEQFFDNQSDDFRTRSLSLARVESYFQPLMLLLIALSTIIVVVVGAYQVQAGKLTAGNIAEFILYVNMLTWPVTAIGWIASTIQEADVSQGRINYLLDSEPAVKNTNHNDYEIKGKIEFRNVSFFYKESGTKALENVSFVIEVGQRIAIMGKTAAGKTTIAELLTRTYDINDGQILVDDIDIKDHNINVLRRDLGYVPQDVFLFSDTIYNNIIFGLPESTYDDVVNFSKHASIYDEIMQFPNNFDTLVGERGITLSGGQKQRISIARAFIKNPRIIVLDDSLSAVDANTEKRIFHYFEQALSNKTSIVITHRANNLLHYDKILIIDHGQLIDQGTHNDLIQREGFYKNLFMKQNKADS